MGTISGRSLGDAALLLAFMNFAERERLADEVHHRQPNLFYSVLVLQRHGAKRDQIEVALNVLLVFYEAMRSTCDGWPIISNDVQERCLGRIMGRASRINGLSRRLQAEASGNSATDHPEQRLLAFVHARFKESGLLCEPTEVGRLLLLAALNLVECIAETTPREAT